MLSTRNYRRSVLCDTPIIYSIVKVNTTPITEPVLLADMKAWLRVDFDDEDAIIAGLISAARAGIEMYCNISIIEKTITMTADWSGEWELPYAPVKSVTSVNARTSNAYEASTTHYIDGSMLQYSSGRVRIVYLAGMNEVEPDLLTDIKRVVAYLYEHRGDESLTSLQGGTDRPKGMDEAMELFCRKYRKIWV